MARLRDVASCVTAMALLAAAACAQKAPPADLLDRAQNAVVAYVDKLAEVHCTENVEQVKLRSNGRADATLKSQYDYFVLLQGNSIDLQLAESRLAMTKEPQHQPPLLLSNGFSMLLLIFHPYYRGSFTFIPEEEDATQGPRAVRYHFSHISGTRTPAALALRDREYPLDLQGSAWIDSATGQPLRIDAELQHPMTDIGLLSLNVHTEYAPVRELAGNPVLPTLADVDLQTPRQHWKNSHTFRDYKLFSTDASQDPNVKVHTTSTSGAQGAPAQPSNQEKP